MSIHDADSFSAAMDPLLENEPLRLQCGKSAGDYIESHLGGTQLIYDAIFGKYKDAGIRILQFDSDYMIAHRKEVSL